MTVHYLPITSTTVTATNDVNGNTENPQMTAGGQVVLPGGRDSKEENDDDVDYYAHERKRKKHRQWADRSSGVYDTSFIMLIALK